MNRQGSNMKTSLLALALAAALPLSAQAADKLSNTSVEADYVNLDNGIDGWGLRGSVDIGSTGFYGLGSYSWTKHDASPSDLDIRSNELGIGYHHSLNGNTDLLGEVAYRNADFDGNLNIDGLRTSVGVRSALGERVEGFVKANHYDLSDYNGDFSGTVGGQVKLNQTWGATAEAELGNGDQAYLVGVRASF